MAKLLGGMGIAHTPTMGHAFDKRPGIANPDRWQEWFAGLEPVKEWIAALKPTNVVVIYNDHLNYFDLSSYPTFAIGMSGHFPQVDEGWGKRDFPGLDGDPEFAAHVAHTAVSEGFDLTFCQELEIDHGIYSWLPCVIDPPWPMRFLPIAVNMVMQPTPTPQRLRALGQCLRKAIHGFEKDARVLVVATGGMSHHIHGTRFGATNQRFDRYFLDNIADNSDMLVDTPVSKIMQVAGAEGAELTMWYTMRAALSDQAKCHYSFHILPEITGCGVITLEEPVGA